MKVVQATQSPWVMHTDEGPVICVVAKVNVQQIELRAVIGNPVDFTGQVIDLVLKPEFKKMPQSQSAHFFNID